MKYFLTALQFLTILPISNKAAVEKEDLGKALAYFPVVGIVIGILLSLTAYVFVFLPQNIKIVMVLIMSCIITGAIHLDGFCDTCDAFCGRNSKEEVLKIMRDSHIGAFGVTGLICLFLLKFVLLVNIPPYILWKVLIVMVVFARWVQVLACFGFDYVRTEGKAKAFMEYAGKKELVLASVFSGMVIFLLMGFEGVILSFFSILPVTFFLFYVKKRIGGMTGDTIGAASEIAEVAIILFTIVCFELKCIY